MKKVTDKDIQRVQDEAAAKIKEYGHMVMGVFADPQSSKPGFAYTAGFEQTYGHPEIIVFGLPPEAAHQMLNDLGARIKGGEKFVDGQIDSEVANMPTTFRNVPPDQIRGHLNMARALQGEIRAVQMIWPDPQGKFEWDEGFDKKYSAFQPLLFKSGAN